MAAGRVNVAKFIDRLLPEPHETNLGGEPVHHLLATVHADWVCPRLGHQIGWLDCYNSANILAAYPQSRPAAGTERQADAHPGPSDGRDTRAGRARRPARGVDPRETHRHGLL
jgi:hypothetical protein